LNLFDPSQDLEVSEGVAQFLVGYEIIKIGFDHHPFSRSGGREARNVIVELTESLLRNGGKWNFDQLGNACVVQTDALARGELDFSRVDQVVEMTFELVAKLVAD
jgi:hypothetical protein